MLRKGRKSRKLMEISVCALLICTVPIKRALWVHSSVLQTHLRENLSRWNQFLQWELLSDPLKLNIQYQGA